LVALEAQGAGPLWKSNAQKMRTRKVEADVFLFVGSSVLMTVLCVGLDLMIRM